MIEDGSTPCKHGRHDMSLCDACFQEQLKQVDLTKAVSKLIEAIKNDEDYRRAWRDNISIAFQDEYAPESNLSDVERKNIQDIANRAADRFLDNLVRVGK